MRLRQFNCDGVDAFRDFLAACRTDPAALVPWHLLDDERLTEVITPPIEIERIALATKGDAARYLNQTLAPVSERVVVDNVGLWTWLSLLLFESICPADEGGRRTVNNDYYYVLDSSSRYVYRHLLNVSWRILRSAPIHNRVMLTSRLNTLDKITTEVMKRLYVSRIPCIFEVLDRLYWDEEMGRPKKGAVDFRVTKPGDLAHRLPARVRQLEKTYDLFSLQADQLLELLGSEFERWHRPSPNGSLSATT